MAAPATTTTPNPRRRRVRAWSLRGLAVVLFVALLLGADVWLGLRQIESIPLRLSGSDSGPGSGSDSGSGLGSDSGSGLGSGLGSGSGQTWLLVGSDSRTRFTAEADRRRYSDTNQNDGERADVLLLLRTGSSPHILSIPRDLFVGAGTPRAARLATALTPGPQHLADTFCSDLGIGIDHLAIVDFEALTEAVDAAGGVTVTTAEPLRDPKARLDLPEAGTQLLDGTQTLAWIRSRHPEALRAGTWTPIPADRAGHLTEVLTQLASTLSHQPLAIHRLLWAAAPHVRVDAATSTLDWLRLGRVLLDLGTSSDPNSAEDALPLGQAPARHVDGPVPLAFPTTATEEALAAYRSPVLCPRR